MNATNMYVPLYITVVEQFVERCFAKLHRLMTLNELGISVFRKIGAAGARVQAERGGADGR